MVSKHHRPRVPHLFTRWTVVVLFVILTACQPAAEPTPETSLPPTDTPVPSHTPFPISTPASTLTPTLLPAANHLGFPLRVAIYRPWQAKDWTDDQLLPAKGRYDSRIFKVVQNQIKEMQSAGIHAGIAYWGGPQDDQNLAAILDASVGEDFYWAVNLGMEKTGDPVSGEIQMMLAHIDQTFAGHPNYLHLDRRFVVFVDVEEADDGCGMSSRWRDANQPQAYLIMQAFYAYQTCSGQPDLWIDLVTETPTDPPVENTLAIQARGWPIGDLAARQRSLNRWGEDVAYLTSRAVDLEIILSYNDWRAGTNIEPADEWGVSQNSFLEILGSNAQNYQDLLQATLFSEEAILVGAGDIAICGSPGMEATAKLLDEIPGTIFTAGDNSNEEGSQANYMECFDPAWGRHKQRIYPAVGNHDYLTLNGMPYFAYFGERAGDPDKAYYSFPLGAWRVIVLNSLCEYAGGCGSDSPQMEWLIAELEANATQCTVAIWHYPLFTSGQRGGNAVVRPFWQVLYEAGAEIIINGHDHHYERFASQDPSGRLDPERGIRQFIIGTGGAGVRPIGEIAANSEERILYTYGVLKLTLRSDSYNWEFIPQAGMGATDSGSGVCH